MAEPQGDSFIVRHFGLDGVREHFMPGNRRRGTPVREKRKFESEADARAWLAERGGAGCVYRCGVCGAFHTASPKRV